MNSTSGIRAVPKRYAQTLFRSTLEADWAATLDHLAIAWEYEPEAVQLPNGDYYRPDFYLPEMTTWLEVKGPHDERLDKTRELARATTHAPHCEETMSGRPIRLVATTDSREGQIERIITAAPAGDSQITVQSVRYTKLDPQNPAAFRRTKNTTYKPKRRLALTHSLLEDLGAVDYEDGCDHDFGRPWRLVVIGRPAQRSSTMFEDATGGRDLSIICCSSCGKNSFFDNTGLWQCRRCGETGKVYHGGSWGTPGANFGDRTLPFVRVPRAGRIAPMVAATHAPPAPRRDPEEVAIELLAAQLTKRTDPR